MKFDVEILFRDGKVVDPPEFFKNMEIITFCNSFEMWNDHDIQESICLKKIHIGLDNIIAEGVRKNKKQAWNLTYAKETKAQETVQRHRCQC